MANLAAQIKDKILGLVDRVAGCGRAGAGKDVQEPTKLHNVQVCIYRSSSICLLVVQHIMHPSGRANAAISLLLDYFVLQRVEVRSRARR